MANMGFITDERPAAPAPQRGAEAVSSFNATFDPAHEILRRSGGKLGFVSGLELCRDCIAKERDLGADLHLLVNEILAARRGSTLPVARFLGFLYGIDASIRALRMDGVRLPALKFEVDALMRSLGDGI